MPAKPTPTKLTDEKGQARASSQAEGSRKAPPSLNRRAFLAASVAAGLSDCGGGAENSPTQKPASLTLSDALARDALGQAELVRSGAVQPIELVEAVIARIEELNPKLNAIVTPMYDLAREAARGEIPDGPFRGAPFLLKDIGATYAGVRYTAGSRALAGNISKVDSELVVRQKQAGLITVAKTNTPEWGLTATTEPHLFGAAHNPWDLERTTGGSSGGSAAAVAARIVPLAHANDGGGSIRIPASCCGLFGLKPTRARNTLAPRAGDILSGLVCEHAVTLTVRDSAALLDATAGPHPGDPYHAPPKQRPFLDETRTEPGSLRIAFSLWPPIDTPVHQDCTKAVASTAKLLEDLGHKVEEAAPKVEMEQYRQAFMVLWLSGFAQTVESIAQASGSEPKPDLYEPANWQLYQQGSTIKAWEYLRAVGYFQALSRRFASFFETYDVWLTPSVAEPPPKLGVLHPGPEVAAPDATRMVQRVFQFVPFTQFANTTGQPAMSVPLHWNDAGLPIGLHFTGRFGDEATLFRLAAQLEQARPWIGRWPPIAGG